MYAFDGTTYTYIGAATMGAGGTYTINLPAGSYKLYVEPNTPGYANQWLGGTDYASATVVTVSGHHHPGHHPDTLTRSDRAACHSIRAAQSALRHRCKRWETGRAAVATVTLPRSCAALGSAQTMVGGVAIAPTQSGAPRVPSETRMGFRGRVCHETWQ